MIDIGLILKELRTKNNLTQPQLAKKMGVAVNTVAGWENQFQFPKIERLVALSRLYHVPLNYIVGIDKEVSIVLDGLTQKQQNLLKSLVLEFQSKSFKDQSSDKGLTERQKNILSDLVAEFRGN